jgi:DNA-binding SARP family transcriptional activator/tetratricopeptide (TPR) repeat protein
VDGVPRFRSQRTVGLLGYLAAERRSIGRAHLAALFWPDEAPAKGRANLSRELHNLAQILPDCWEASRQAVALAPTANTSVDIYELPQLEEQERWEEAAELLGGEFMEGLYLDDNAEFENWLLGERERWRRRSETVLRRVSEVHQRRGRYTEALQQTQRLLQLAPWDEEAHRQGMRLLAWTGQQGAARRQFEHCKQALWEELAVEPAPETITLYQEIQSGKLDLPPQLPAFLTAERARHAFERARFVGREGELAQLEANLEGALSGQGRVVFISGGPGRGKTALLEDFVQGAMERYPGMLVAKGNCNAYSGVGDPYLPYRDVMAMLTGEVEARWDAGAISREHASRLWAAVPLVVQVLLEQGPQLLEVLVPGEALLSRCVVLEQEEAAWMPRLREQVNRQKTNPENIDQSHLFQQATNVLTEVSQEQPLLLILDDLQWADAASISLLFHLGRRLAEADSRVLIACAYRPEEVAVDRAGERHPLAKVISEFKRSFDNVLIDLGQAAEDEQRSFVDALLDIEPNRFGARFRAAMFERTAGHPLFTIELLRAMKARGDLVEDADGVWIEGPSLDWEMLPERVEAVIEERVERLEPALRELLTSASVEGEVFTVQVVAEVQQMPERTTVHQLSQDLERRHRLVREQEEVYTGRRRLWRYRFRHILFQEYLYRQLSQGERRLLHGEVATALETLYAGQLDELAVQLAQHFDLAGDNEKAFDYFSLAGERAARLYESGEAIRHYTRAIQLADQVVPEAGALAKLHSGRALAFERLGMFERARADHEMPLRIARTAGEGQVELIEWRALLDLGKLWRSRDYSKARDYIEAALELARQMDDPAVLATSLNWMGNWYANDEDPKRASDYHQEALTILETLGDKRELANTLDLLGLANVLVGELTSSMQYYDRAIALFRELGDRHRLVSSLTGRAIAVSVLIHLVSVPAASGDEAASDFGEALRIAGEIGSVSDQAWAYYALGMLDTVHGQYGRALENMRSSLRMTSEIGHREYVVGAQVALGMLSNELNAPDQAREQLERALTLSRELRSPTWFHLVSGALAGTYLMLDDLESTNTCLEMVISPQTRMDTLGKRYCWARRVQLALAQGEPALALEIVDQLIETAPGMEPGAVVTFLWLLKAEALAALGRADEARSLLYEAIENARENEERFLLWRVHASLGRLYEATGHQAEASDEFAAASEIVGQLADSIDDEALRDNFLEGAMHALRRPAAGN